MGLRNIFPPSRSPVTRTQIPTPARLTVWDTQYAPASRLFDSYRDALSAVCLPWLPAWEIHEQLEARIEAVRVREGTISRLRCTPHILQSSATDVARLPVPRIFVVSVFSGEIEVLHGDHCTIAGRGESVLMNGACPVKVSMGYLALDALIIGIPRGELSLDADRYLRTIVLGRLESPFSDCLRLIGERLTSASHEELLSLYDASRALLPGEAKAAYVERASEDQKDTYLLLGRIKTHIDQSLPNANLRATSVAARFGISDRYLRKLFNGAGDSFNGYVLSKRFDGACRDLTAEYYPRESISEIARRWGFKESSNFNRAFKARYGCTPSQFRNKAGW